MESLSCSVLNWQCVIHVHCCFGFRDWNNNCCNSTTTTTKHRIRKQYAMGATERQTKTKRKRQHKMNTREKKEVLTKEKKKSATPGVVHIGRLLQKCRYKFDSCSRNKIKLRKENNKRKRKKEEKKDDEKRMKIERWE